MNNELANTGRILIYQNEKGDTKVDVYFTEDTIWMTQKSMCELYQVAKSSISEHIRNIFLDGELEEKATVRKFRTVQKEGSRQVARELDYYNLDMILAVGYRVRSNVGIHFRRWASGVLTEYMKKGFVLNDERLRNPKEFGADYFDELLERIRDIRASEKRVYQKVKEIFALSVDYDSQSSMAQNFFKSVQNKLEYAATGYTAPEIIAARADATKNNMGLTSFKGAKVRKSDVTVGKNYMTNEELSTLNLIVNMYLDYAELQAKNHRPMHMADWEEKLNQFLQFNGREVLQNFGTVKREVAEALALAEYEKYDAHRKMIEAADVDQLSDSVKRLKQ
ncbi:MAG: virulence RhuM family protein [Candidatus Faecousia sp.]|uniref:virulence RhuM family protein n=1 Tax=Faecousia sp. TaxID=2952921 RepID=UPI002A8F5E20|nr:virulence RhuM family protein [Candidatus Faecousia sp.]